jgi:hypothetical protein
MASKNAGKILPYQKDGTRTGYEMKHCNMVGKFLVIELNQVADPEAKSKPPLIS